MSEQIKADAAIAKWKGRFSEALGNPSTDAWLAGGGAALLAYMLSGGNKKLKKNPLMRLLLSGGAGLAAIGGVNAWDRYKARKAPAQPPRQALAPAPPQETFSDDTEAIQEAANTSAAILEQERAVAEQQQQLFSRAERSANATSTQAPQPTRTSTPTGGALDNKFMRAGGVYRGNPNAAPKTLLGEIVEQAAANSALPGLVLFHHVRRALGRRTEDHEGARK